MSGGGRSLVRFGRTVRAGAIALLLSAAPALRAQDAEPFSPAQELAGYTEAQLGEASDLYRLAPFDALEGRVLTAAELADVQRKWGEERARVAAELEHLSRDPVARSHRRLDRKLAQHPYFSKVDLVECADFPPFLFLVEKPP